MDRMIKKTLTEADNEGTAAPYWLIIDPGRYSVTRPRDISNIAACIVGPYFCREDAELYLAQNRHNYTDNAQVWCASGHASHKYKRLCDELGVGR